MLPHKLSSMNASFASLDSDSNVITTLFSPTADSGTVGFQGSALAKGTVRDRERTSTPTPMLGVQQPVFQPVTRQSSFSNEGRITPTFDDGAKKMMGREKGAMSYSAEDHIYLLSGMKTITDSFNATESSPEWKSLYKLMVEQYYKINGYNMRPSSMLQSHFVDMYSAFKNGIRISSLASTKVKNIAPNTLSAHNLKDVQSKIKSTETLQNQKQNREKQGRHDPSSALVKSEPDVIGINDDCQIATEAAATTDSQETKSNISSNLKVVNEESEGSIPGEPPTKLLLIKPYHFDKYRGFAEVNNQSGVDLTATQGKEQSE